MSSDKDKKELELKIRIAAQEALAAVSSLKGEVQSMAGEFKRFSEADGAALNRAFKSVKEETDRAAASFRLFGASGNELRNVQAQLKTAAVELARQGFDPQGKEVRDLVDEYKRLGREAKELDDITGRNIDSFGQLQSALMSVAEVAAFAKIAGKIKDLGSFALSTADDFQTMRNQFGVLLGDMEAGAGLFNRIKLFGDKTSFDLSTLAQATNVLIAAKVPLGEMEDQLRKFGDLSQGNSQRLISYVNAFSMAAAKGKADMMTLNTYLNQGVTILDALAENFGTTTDVIVEMSSQGKISFEDFSRALDDLTAAGGRYFGGMELASESLAMMKEGLKEAVNSLAASFGDMLMPTAKDVYAILTEITNAIEESPIMKGVFAGLVVALGAYLSALAAKATVVFAAQMKVNLSFGALNPVILAATVAVAGMAAVYTKMAADAQKATRESENLAAATRSGASALNDAADAANRYADAFSRMSQAEISRNMQATGNAIRGLEEQLQRRQRELQQLPERETVTARGRTYGTASTERARVQSETERLERELAEARGALEAQRQGLRELQSRNGAAADAPLSIAPASVSSGRDEAAAWRERWAEEYRRFQAQQSGDPFAITELDRSNKLGEAEKYGAREAVDQINEYYSAERSRIMRELHDEETRLAVSLSKTRVDDLEYQMRKQLEAVEAMEQMRVIAAGESEEAIAAIREQYAKMSQDITKQYEDDIARTKFEEAKDAIVDWRQTLEESLSTALMNMEMFSNEAGVILGGLTAQFAELAAGAALNGFEEFGRALGEGTNAAESLEQALAAMSRQILQQLPMMFLQAGLQLIASGQWPLGLGFIAAAGASAITSGFVDGQVKKAQAEASKNAAGGVYDECGRAAAFAAGGIFTNRIVNEPTHFRFASGAGFAPGVMGEAGPEAIMPLKRMSNGDLGIQTQTGGSAQVTVNIINNTSAEVRCEETEDASGNAQIDVIIGGMVNSHISSGKADRVMGSRYGLRAQGV